MSDEFDLLETSSNEKQEKVDVNWGKAIDTMKSKLAQEDDPEVRQKILNATLDDVVHMAEKDRTTLLDAIKDLTDYQEEVGIIFEDFSSLNADEQKIIDSAIRKLERANKRLPECGFFFFHIERRCHQRKESNNFFNDFFPFALFFFLCFFFFFGIIFFIGWLRTCLGAETNLMIDARFNSDHPQRQAS